MSLATVLAADPERCAQGFHLSQHPRWCGCTEGTEWAIFLRVVQECVRADGLVHVNDARPKLRGRLEPSHIGQSWGRAHRDGLIAHHGWEPSTDVAGGNSDKLARVWRWIGGVR